MGWAKRSIARAFRWGAVGCGAVEVREEGWGIVKGGDKVVYTKTRCLLVKRFGK